MLTIQELEALRGLVQINVNINLPKGHHPMAYDQVRIPLSWKPTSVTTVDMVTSAGFTFTVRDAITDVFLEFGQTVGSLRLGSQSASSALVSCSGQDLQSVGDSDLNISDFPLLQSIALPKLSTIAGSVVFSNNPSLTSITLPLSVLGGDFTADGAALTEAQIDAILALLAAATSDGATPWSGTATLDGGTSAPPSAAGLVSKGIIEGHGGTVTVNS